MSGDEKKVYEKIKREIKEAIEGIRQKMPEAAAYLDEHIIFNDENCTFMYNGDDRIKVLPINFG